MGNLVLSRRTGESITIQTGDGPVMVTVGRVARDVVRLAIRGPREVVVYRSELDWGKQPVIEPDLGGEA